jgi:hypothetical protein
MSTYTVFFLCSITSIFGIFREYSKKRPIYLIKIIRSPVVGVFIYLFIKSIKCEFACLSYLIPIFERWLMLLIKGILDYSNINKQNHHILRIII